MPAPLSAVDAVSPAFSATRRVLFQPFRFATWSRLAWIALLTGEFVGGGFSGGSNFNMPSTANRRRWDFIFTLTPPFKQGIEKFLPWILFFAGVGLLLGLFWIYASSVGRFILLDAVLRGRYRFREGWKRWQQPGLRYFFWQLGFTFAMLLVLLLVIGLPVFLAWRAGLLLRPGSHVGILVAGGIVLVLAAMCIILFSAVIALVAKDFLVPVMAFENCTVTDGWKRLWPMMAAEKWAYAGYVLMKIVLAIGSAIFFSIVDFLMILFLLIPFGILGAAAYFFAKSAGLSWNPATIGAVVILGLAALAAIFWVIAFVYSPGLVFFQSYTLQFFGTRYAPLGSEMFPPPPAPPPLAPPEPFAPAG
jgi:hypothetical protein